MIAALLRRDLQIRASYRLILVIDLFIGTIDVLVYYFISRTFEGTASTALGAAPSYFAFALVGIVITAVVQAASSGVAMSVREEQLTGTLEHLVAQPLTPTEMSLGMCALPFAFAIVRVALYLIIGGAVLGTDFSDTSWVGFAAVLAATGAAMSAVGIVTAAAVLVLKRGQTISGLIVFGMSFVGGAFFPVSVLPGWLEKLGSILPPRFAFDGLRQALYAGSGWADDALILFGLSLVVLPASVWLFHRALEHARRGGTIAQY